MCGRTACTLDPQVIRKACTHVDPKTQKHQQPEWREHPVPESKQSDQEDEAVDAEVENAYKYYPSANIPPTKFVPVLINEDESESWILQPMMWSLIPHWAQSAKSHGMSTNNCRLEGLPTSKLFKRALTQRRMCAIPCQGFYEWKTVGEKGQDEKSSSKQPKQPYLIFMPQEKDIKLDDIGNDAIWNEGTWDEDKGWTGGPRLLMMAGLYDTWESLDGEKIYSFTVITMEANETLSWLHHRMPAILETPEQVYAWLNPRKGASVQEMLSVLKPPTSLDWYPVSTKVNSSRCHDLDCTKRFNPKEKKSNTFMDNWLKRTPKVKKEEEDSKEGKEDGEVAAKKPKVEPH